MKTRAPICFVALALASFMAAGCGNRNQVNYEDLYERAIGELFGERVAATAPGGGTVVVLLRQGTDEVGQLKNQAYLEGLRKGLNSDAYIIKEAGPDLSNVKPQHQVMVMKALSHGWPVRAIMSWAKVEKNAVAVVSFIEFPSGLRARSLAKLPPLFVHSPTSAHSLRQLAAHGAIKALVIARSGSDKEAKPPRKASAEEIVNLRYEIIGP